jgi:hypothetical protein
VIWLLNVQDPPVVQKPELVSKSRCGVKDNTDKFPPSISHGQTLSIDSRPGYRHSWYGKVAGGGYRLVGGTFCWDLEFEAGVVALIWSLKDQRGKK